MSTGRLTLAIVSLMLVGLSANAAEIKLLDGPVFSLADHFPADTEANITIYQEVPHLPSNRAAQIKSYGWNFEPPYRLDGALSYPEVHARAFASALKLSKVVLIEGPINRGDFDRLKSVFDENKLMDCLSPKICPFNTVIALNSEGNLFSEALKIAEFVSNNDIPVVVLKDHICESACSLIFFNGYSDYGGYFFPRRAAHVSAKIGVHRPSITVADGAIFPSENVRLLVDYLIELQNSIVNSYTDASVSVGTLGDLYETDASQMHYLDYFQMLNEGVTILGKVEPVQRQITIEDVGHICSRKLVSLKANYTGEKLQAKTLVRRQNIWR